MVKEQTTPTTEVKEAADKAADVSNKRKYFLPQTEQVVEADSAREAAKQAKKDEE